MHVLEIDKNILYRDDPSLTSKELEKIKKLIERRETGEPLAYLTNNIGFWNLDLYVNRRVLVPRPETEVLVQNVLEDFNSERIAVLDLGTGSGAIGLSLAKDRPDWLVTCSDISLDALKVASINMSRNSINVQLVNTDWLNSFKPKHFDVIVTNPPYINSSDPRIFSDGLKYEPIEALVSDSEGLGDIKKIIQQGSKMLKYKGCLFIEHGYDQSDKVVDIFKSYGFSGIKSLKDLNGHNRVCVGQLNKC
jgi:release factor glutamine methyltransferase